ncbi:MAG: NfeD family protein [Solimicrobium sp.]|jgi:membrane protein implicated in regulation of membrane protease activity|nr:NfeD family protein [Solimicrobium sp.]
MSEWMNWLIVAGIMVVLEMFTGTFYLLMIAVGLLAASLVAFLGLTSEYQIITAALVGAIATISLRRSRFGITHKVKAARDPNVNLDIGQSIQINEWHSNSTGVFSARAMHRGALWDVKYVGKEEPGAGTFKIVEIQGSQLVVEHVKG